METNEIQKKIQELQSLAEKSNVNIDSDIKRLSEKLGEGARMTPADLWKKIQLARHSDRPTTLEIIAAIAESFMEFHGDRYFGDDAAMVGGVGLIEGRPVTFIGHQKGRNMKETREQIEAKFWPTMYANWKVWPFVNFVNFYLIPMRYQVLWNSFFSMFFNAYLSFMHHRGID